MLKDSFKSLTTVLISIPLVFSNIELIKITWIAFGIRNVPKIELALQEAYRVLKKGGRFLCMEFSKVENPLFSEIYKFYNFNIIPTMGDIIAKDRESYQYLVKIHFL